jgi:hypothetical protein
MKLSNKTHFATLPKIGISCHFPRCMVIAPKYFGGLGLLDFPTRQGYLHIDTLVRHMRTESTLQTTIIQASEAFQVKKRESQHLAGRTHKTYHTL